MRAGTAVVVQWSLMFACGLAGSTVMTVAFLDVPSTGRAVMLLMVIVPTAVVGWIAAKFGAYRRIYAPECGDGQLQLDSLGLIVRLPGVLAEPVRFSEKSIEAVLVHTRADARPDRARFLLGSPPTHALWTVHRRSTIPILSAIREPPSVVVVFTAQQSIPHVSGSALIREALLAATSSAAELPGSPPVAPDQPCLAVGLKVKRPEALAAALRSRPLGSASLDLLKASELGLTPLPLPTRARAWMFPTLALALLVVLAVSLLAAFGLLPWLLAAALLALALTGQLVKDLIDRWRDAESHTATSRWRRALIALGAGGAVILFSLDLQGLFEKDDPPVDRQPDIPSVPDNTPFVMLPTTIPFPELSLPDLTMPEWPTPTVPDTAPTETTEATG